MTLRGANRLRRQLRHLQGGARDHVVRAIRRGTQEGARVARVLAPEDTGETRRGISTRYEDDGMRGIVEAAPRPATRAEKDRVYSIEHGRKRGDHGTTEGSHHMYRAKIYIAKKNKDRVKRAIRKAVREAARRG